MIIARQSTARTVTVGPVLDADGVAVTGGVVGDLKIAKNGGAPAALDGSATLTHRHTGYYSLELTASDLDTVGQAEVVMDDTVNAMPIKELTVVEEAIYDIHFAASATGAVPVASIAAGAINAAAIATDAIDADALAADAIAEINATVDTALADYDGPTNAEMEARTIAAASYATATALQTVDDEIATIDGNVDTLVSRITSTLFAGITSLAEWLGLMAGKQTGDATARTELRATGAGSGTFDETADSQEALRDRGDAAWTTATGFSTHSASDVWAVGTRTLTANTNLNDPTAAAIADAVWTEAIADHSGTAGSTAEQLAAAGSAGDPWATALPGAYTAGQAGKIVGDNINATVGSRASQTSVDTAQADLDILTGTDGVTLATSQPNYAPATAASLATAQTDLDTLTGADGATLATSQPNYAPSTAAALTAVSNTIGVDGAGLTEAGGTGDHLTALATQASVDDLPTNAELATALAAADDAVLAAITALNNLSAADVNAQVVDALATDTYAEPGAAPAATATLAAKISFLAALARNKVTQTATTQTLRNDADSADIATAAVSDDGTTFTRAEWQ